MRRCFRKRPVVSYTTFSPLPRALRRVAVCSLWHFPSAPIWQRLSRVNYGTPCSVESGLSSPHRRSDAARPIPSSTGTNHTIARLQPFCKPRDFWQPFQTGFPTCPDFARPAPKLPGSDAALFWFSGDFSAISTTGFRRLLRRRPNSENRKQNGFKTEASKPGSWRAAKHAVKPGVRNR